MFVLSFDVEDWFHLIGIPSLNDIAEWDRFEPRASKVMRELLDLLDSHSLKGLFFTLGWWATRNPSLVAEIKDRGHILGSHSFSHRPLWSYKRKHQLVEDLRRGLDVLTDITGERIEFFRAPGFSITRNNLHVMDILMELGIRYDSSLFHGQHAHGGIDRLPACPFRIQSNGKDLIELPLIKGKLLGVELPSAGGGYFRLLPFWLFRTALRAAMRDNGYFNTYFHPRDFDHDQPRMQLPALRYFRSYIGLRSSLTRLARLLHYLATEAISVNDFPSNTGENHVLSLEDLQNEV